VKGVSVKTDTTGADDIGATTTATIRRGKLARAMASSATVLGAVCVALTACAGAAEDKQPISSAALACDDGLRTAMARTPDTKVLLVRPFKRGDPLLLTRAASAGALEHNGPAGVITLAIADTGVSIVPRRTWSVRCGMTTRMPLAQCLRSRAAPYGVAAPLARSKRRGPSSARRRSRIAPPVPETACRRS
jgi:hypothetical protein